MRFRLRTLFLLTAGVATALFASQHADFSMGYVARASTVIDGDGNAVSERPWAWVRVGWNKRACFYWDSERLSDTKRKND